MRNTVRAPHGAATQHGRTLIEVMVAMVLGVVVIGSILSTVISTSASTRTQDGVARLTEDAQIALNIVAGHLRMAGFSLPRVNARPDRQAANYEGAAVRGCDGPIQNMGMPMDVFVCAGVNQPNAFSVAYEADQWNTLPVGGVPTDCLGRGLVPQVSPLGGNFFVAENRFFIRNGANGNPELACAGNGQPGGFAAPQALVENVEDMRLVYGASDMIAVPDFTLNAYAGVITDFFRADQLDAAWPAQGVMERWRRVSNVQLCLLMRSDDFVTDDATPYTDCNGNVVTPADRRLRVAVSTTINLRNGSLVDGQDYLQ